jgi:putative addiction module CopG family antidote
LTLETSVIQCVTAYYLKPNAMRSIINISMPAELKKEIELAVKEGNYASKSEFIRDAIRALKRQRIVEEIEQAEQDILSGKAKLYTSVKEMHDDILKDLD